MRFYAGTLNRKQRFVLFGLLGRSNSIRHLFVPAFGFVRRSANKDARPARNVRYCTYCISSVFSALLTTCWSITTAPVPCGTYFGLAKVSLKPESVPLINMVFVYEVARKFVVGDF